MYLVKTLRFSVLTIEKPFQRDHESSVLIPSMELSRLCKGFMNDEKLHHDLLDALRNHGFIVLTLPSNSLPAKIIQDLKLTLSTDFFPNSGRPSFMSMEENTNDVYISEKGIPMWKVGYEFCADDGVREAFRVPAGWPDGVVYPSSSVRSKWIRALALCRYICDRALQVALTLPKIQARHGSQSSCWKHTDYSSQDQQPLPDRSGDYSVLYAMHYFNKKKAPYRDGNVPINVKQHVDPSLFVLEPFLAEEPGLQVLSQGRWIACDGPASPIHDILTDNQTAMVLFVGNALSRHLPSVQPTMHRVIASQQQRRTVIYEQKYQEYFPSPHFD